MKILVAYRGMPNARGWEVGAAVCRALRILGHSPFPYGTMHQQDARIHCFNLDSGEAPDGLIYVECNDNDPQYAELAQLKCKKVYWEFDTAMHFERTAQWLQLMQFDAVFFANAEFADRFAADGVKYLPYGVDHVFFGPASEIRSGAACLGSDYPERRVFCEAAGVELITGKSHPAYAQELRRIAVSVHHHASGGKGLLVARIWDSLGSGACLLTEKDTVLDRHFVDGQHLVTYTSPEMCRELVDWLLKNPDIARAAAQAGYEEVKAKHTYVERCKVLLEAIK